MKWLSSETSLVLYSVYDLPVYMIYRCKFKTLDFLSLDLLTSGSFLPNGHKNSRHLSETVKIVSVSEFGVKTINNFITFDFPYRIMCASYQIHRQHPWIRKTILQNLSSAPTPTQIISRCFFKICIISFSYLVKHIYRCWHLFLFAPIDHITSQASARIW